MLQIIHTERIKQKLSCRRQTNLFAVGSSLAIKLYGHRHCTSLTLIQAFWFLLHVMCGREREGVYGHKSSGNAVNITA